MPALTRGLSGQNRPLASGFGQKQINLILRNANSRNFCYPPMQTISLFVILSLFCHKGSQAPGTELVKAGVNFFDAVKLDRFDQADLEITALANAKEDELALELDTQPKAMAFWLNIYNTFVQYLLKKNPELFNDRDEFFKTKHITIAGNKLSLDDIEHGIIRHSRNKYALGYFGSFFVSDFEEKFRLESIDYRIHFALNCGAKSCPPVILYNSTDIEMQLERSTGRYLNSFAKYDSRKNIVSVPALCSWFKADFGGESGILLIMKKYNIVPTQKDPEVEYLPYDWTLRLSNYITQ
jgi:hypothetical protein